MNNEKLQNKIAELWIDAKRYRIFFSEAIKIAAKIGSGDIEKTTTEMREDIYYISIEKQIKEN